MYLAIRCPLFVRRTLSCMIDQPRFHGLRSLRLIRFAATRDGLHLAS
jgi:hypothetical protein